MIDSGELHFSVEAKLLRELGERLVKQPEVAILELVKNAYDADAATCDVQATREGIRVADDGRGMTLDEFQSGWMRLGTSTKSREVFSPKYKRKITGEKGIGRFAVRFLGGSLRMRTVAHDAKRRQKTLLVADFDWPSVDRYSDLNEIGVPYTLHIADADVETGTTLEITDLRVDVSAVSWADVKTASMPILSPAGALLALVERASQGKGPEANKADPGFRLTILGGAEDQGEAPDVASAILESYVLRATLVAEGNRLALDVYAHGANPELSIRDRVTNLVGPLHAEIRFYPKRKGSFAGLPVDGRRALGWVSGNSGIGVYDRAFRVLPYGTPGDDWLSLAQDTARRAREPRSTLARRHFPMSREEATSTELNYMLRLPHPNQVIGVVSVESMRGVDDGGRGLIPAADREGFLDNDAFRQLANLIRGAVEAIAHVDRTLQKKAEDEERRAEVRRLRAEARQTIAEIRANPRLKRADKQRLIQFFTRAQRQVEEGESAARRREEQLQILSLLGVVAGFMTHEFGVALDNLERGRDLLVAAATDNPSLEKSAATLGEHIDALREYASYSRAYIGASNEMPKKPYPVQPRLKQVVRVFGTYAEDRGISVEVEAARDLIAPPVPAALYNGVALNLYTNALKAIIARAGREDRRIAFRAWNEGGYQVLLVADTGVGIPSSLQDRVFDPLVSTTTSNSGPLGSGMGLGLTLVRRAVESFSGKVAVVEPPPGFVTAVEVRLPLPRE